MSKRLLRILNFCAMLFVPLAVLPLLIIYHAAMTGLLQGGITPLRTDRLLLQLLFCELCCFAGKYCGLAADSAGIGSALRRVLAVPTGGIVAAAMFGAFWLMDPLGAPGMAVFGAILFWVGGGIRFFSYGELLSLRVFYGYLTEYTVVLAVLEIFKINPCTPMPFAVALFAGLLMVLFGSNQAGIDYMMERRHHRFDLLPAKIRSYNIRLFVMIAAVLLLLLVLYRPIGWLVSTAGSGLLAALKWLLGLLPKGESGQEVSEQPQEQAGQNGGNMLEPGESSPFWTYFGIVVAIGGIYLLYYYRHEIYMGLRSAWRTLKAFLQRLFWGGRQKADRDENEYYTETDEKVAADETSIGQSLSLSDRRKWRRACRRFAAQTDSPQTLRNGYRLILQGIELQGVPVEASDTTLEICGNAQQNGLPTIEKCTSGYNCLRYGELDFDLNSMADIRAALTEILKYRKK